jgi:hypothetical protein
MKQCSMAIGCATQQFQHSSACDVQRETYVVVHENAPDHLQQEKPKSVRVLLDENRIQVTNKLLVRAELLQQCRCICDLRPASACTMTLLLPQRWAMELSVARLKLHKVLLVKLHCRRCCW